MRGYQFALDHVRVCRHALVGPHAPFDTARWQALQETVDRRTQNAVAAFNHIAAVTASPPWAERLPAIACPTLVIHGSADPCLPPVHGQQLAARIPGATLRTIPGMGHLFPPEWSETIAEVIAGHLP